MSYDLTTALVSIVLTVLFGIVVWLLLNGTEQFRVEDVQSVENDTDEMKNSPEIIEVSVEDFDNYFGRSAGRYCEHCGIHGSHHTDRHNDYAMLVKSKIG